MSARSKLVTRRVFAVLRGFGRVCDFFGRPDGTAEWDTGPETSGQWSEPQRNKARE